MSDSLMPIECPFCSAVVVAKTHGQHYPYFEHIDFKCGTHWTANVGFRRECVLECKADAPATRQSVAEKFLEAWVGTATYVDAMYALRAMADFLDARDGVNIQRLLDMARVLDQAAREDGDK